jgi:hypothetical protein
MTLREIYLSIDNTPPKRAWIKKLAKATHRNFNTVRGWVAGRYPDELTQNVIAKKLNISVNELFPKK